MSNKRNKSKKTFRGILIFFSETGTEGGDWAFQETRYIKKNVKRGFCKKCGKWLIKQEGPIQISKVVVFDQQAVEEMERTEKLPQRPSCPNNTHEEDIGDAYDYKGLHILEDGDHLKIYSKDNPRQVVWSGLIKLRQYEVFTEDALGLWIHADQTNVNRETWARWFFDEHPATLIPAQLN